MYSVVLMMALSGSAEVPAWHGGYGCDGGGGCWGGRSWGHGCNGGLFGRGHGCHGGLLGHRRGHGCYGGAVAVGHGCVGAPVAAAPPPPPPVVHGCYGGGCYGGNGCYGGGGHGCFGGLFHRHRGYGCCGSAPVVVHGCVGGQAAPYPPPPMYKGKGPEGGEKLKTPPKEKKQSEEAAVAAPATIVVSLPADARLLIDDNVTASTSVTRVFASPALEPGKDFYYTLKGELRVDDRTLTASERVKVRAGEETRIQLQFPSATIAQR